MSRKGYLVSRKRNLCHERGMLYRLWIQILYNKLVYFHIISEIHHLILDYFKITEAIT